MMRIGKNYTINNSTSMNTMLVILNKSKFWSKYMVMKKKNEINCFLYVFEILISKSLSFILLNKNNFFIYN